MVLTNLLTNLFLGAFIICHCIFQYVLDTGEGWRGNANKTTRLHSIFTEVETLSDIESPCLWMSF